MKLNEITTNSHAEIELILQRYGISNYKIRPDGTVDVNGNVTMVGRKFKKLPVKFGRVTGSFNCHGSSMLESLNGAPTFVGSYFDCSECDSLTSLEGAPEAVERAFVTSRCAKLTSLNGSPTSVGGNFSCYGCPLLSSLEGAPINVGGNFNLGQCANITSLEGFVTKVEGTITCNWDYIKHGGISLAMSGAKMLRVAHGPFEIIEKYLHRPDDIFDCQMELIDAGYAKYAQL